MARHKENSIDVVNVRLVKEPSIYAADPIKTPEDVLNVVANELKQYDREVFAIINLKTSGQIINLNICSVGTLNSSLISPREVFKSAILSNAAAFIAIHVTGKPPVPLQTKNKRKRGTSCENSSFFVFCISTRPASLLARLFHLGNPLFAFFRKLLRPWKQVLQEIQIRIIHVFRNLGQQIWDGCVRPPLSVNHRYRICFPVRLLPIPAYLPVFQSHVLSLCMSRS